MFLIIYKMHYKQTDIDKLENLKYDIKAQIPGSVRKLIFLWETLPREIWTYYNNNLNGFDRKTWAACLIFINKWEKSKDKY